MNLRKRAVCKRLVSLTFLRLCVALKATMYLGDMCLRNSLLGSRSSIKYKSAAIVWDLISPWHFVGCALAQKSASPIPKTLYGLLRFSVLLWILPLSPQQWLNLPPNFFTLDWPRCSCFVPELRLGRLRLKPRLLRSAQIYMTYGVLGPPLPIPLRVHFSDKQKHIRAQAPHFTLCALAPGDAFLEPLAWSLTNGSSWLSFKKVGEKISHMWRIRLHLSSLTLPARPLLSKLIGSIQRSQVMVTRIPHHTFKFWGFKLTLSQFLVKSWGTKKSAKGLIKVCTRLETTLR